MRWNSYGDEQKYVHQYGIQIFVGILYRNI